MADDQARGFVLRALGESGPPAGVLVVTASAEELREGACERALPSLLEAGQARAALLLPPASAFCGHSEALPFLELPAELVRMDRDGAVIGFNDPGPAQEALRELGIASARWVAPTSPASVPVVALSDLEASRVAVSVLQERIIVVGTEGALEAHSVAGGETRLPLASRAAAALGGLLEGGARREAPSWAGALLVLVVGAVLGLVRRRSGFAGAALALLALLGAIAALSFGLAAKVTAGLLPVASILLGVLVVFVGIAVPAAIASRRALKRAADSFERAGADHVDCLCAIPDDEFWVCLARLAEQVHPAARVLLAELPPGSFRLELRSSAGADAQFPAEPERDVRKPPYSTSRGAPSARVVRNFLANPDTPAVLVPLMAQGEMEGYALLCGEEAERAYLENPDSAERLSRELGRLIRSRRLRKALDFGVLQGMLGAPSKEAAKLAQGADAVLGDLNVLGAVVRGAPVDLLYADAFGEVRLLGRGFAEWLASSGARVPDDKPDTLLPPGSLRLIDVLRAAGATGQEATLASVMAAGENGVAIKVVGTNRLLCVRALRQRCGGISWIAGYTASLVAQEAPASPTPSVRAFSAATLGDPLRAFSLSDLLSEATESASRAADRPIQFDPERPAAPILGYRGEIASAIKAFLTDVAAHGMPGQAPVLTLRDAGAHVELCVLDCGFGLGLPESALQRVLMAPGAPPPGLETLGRLVTAVEDSHGSVQIKSQDGWGLTVVLSFLRAHSGGRGRSLLAAGADDASRALAKGSLALNGGSPKSSPVSRALGEGSNG